MADQLLNRHPVGEVPSSDWPYAISELLHPEAVRIASEGLYIVTSRRFVDEAGIFVAREASWTDTDPAEPFFTPIADRVFEFQAPG
jgi:hypothetical protein